MGKQRNGENKICIACGKTFYVASYRVKTARFCSLECQNHGQYKRSKHQCQRCKKIFEDSPSRYKKRIYCSLECRDAESMDEKDRRRMSKYVTLSKRGVSSQRIVRRIAFALKQKQCEMCGYKEFDFCLDVHHKDKNPLNNKIENLEILCVMCHRKHHYQKHAIKKING